MGDNISTLPTAQDEALVKNFNWKDLLGQHSLFESLDSKEVERIIAHLLDDKVSEEREYSDGKIIVREGEPGASVFLVGRGSVQVLLEGENGADTPIATLRQGEFFGEMALIEKKPRAATVKAKESCVLLEIKGQEFLKLLDEHKDVESKMLLKLSERLRHANDQVLAVRVRGVDEKIDALKIKHEAELKAVDAQLKAAIAIFDQTKIRTDEVISSAERSRSQRTWFFGIFATLLTGASVFGLKEIANLKDHADAAKVAVGVINKIKEDIESNKPDLQRLSGIAESLNTFIRDNKQPEFRKALLEGEVEDIDNSYSSLQQIHKNMNWFLDDVEIAIRAKPEHDYTRILQSLLRDSQNRRERMRAHYLLVTNAILADKTDLFARHLKDFSMYLKIEGPIKPEDKLNALKDVFDTQEPERRKRFEQVEKLLSKG